MAANRICGAHALAPPHHSRGWRKLGAAPAATMRKGYGYRIAGDIYIEPLLCRGLAGSLHQKSSDRAKSSETRGRSGRRIGRLVRTIRPGSTDGGLAVARKRAPARTNGHHLRSHAATGMAVRSGAGSVATTRRTTGKPRRTRAATADDGRPRRSMCGGLPSRIVGGALRPARPTAGRPRARRPRYVALRTVGHGTAALAPYYGQLAPHCGQECRVARPRCGAPGADRTPSPPSFAASVAA